jgi:hypothetical protein
LVSIVWLELNCASNNNLNPSGTGGAGGAGGGTGGLKGQASGGTIAIGGQAGTGRCLDGPTGQGGNECRAPVIVVVDAETGAVICDPTFSVVAGDAGAICDPTGDPTPELTRDGSTICSFRINSLENVAVPVNLYVTAPGYQSTVLRQLVGCHGGADTPMPVGLMPTGDGGVHARDASRDLGTTCTIDNSVDDCSIRGLDRYVCPVNAPVAAQGCSPTGEDNFDGITTRCCPPVPLHDGGRG